jgi:serine protease inhibitor
MYHQKRENVKIFLLCFAQFLALVASLPTQEIIPDDLGNNTKDYSSILSKSVSSFNSKVLKNLADLENGNILYSPLGLHMLLFQIYSGTPINSSASIELEELLEMKPDEDIEFLNDYQITLNSESDVKVGNKIYVAEKLKIKPEFENITSTYFKSAVDKFTSVKKDGFINNNFLGQSQTDLDNPTLDTDLKIINSMQFKEEGTLSTEAELVVLNTIHFEGNWKHPFKLSGSKEMTFQTDDATQAQFTAMTLTEQLKTTYVPELESDILELPYQNEEISMIILLPSNKTDIRKVEKNIHNLEVFVRNLELINTSIVQVTMPKFEQGVFTPNLMESLQSLGVDSLFGNPDLSVMIDAPLVISQMNHSGSIKVNEGNQPGDNKTDDYDNEFVINKPFIFYIYDRINHLPILAGRIVDPNGHAKLQPESSGTGTKDATNNLDKVTDAPDDTTQFVVEPTDDIETSNVDKIDDTTLPANTDGQITERVHDQPSQLQGYNLIFGSELLS